jgi:L-aspartate oxidase
MKSPLDPVSSVDPDPLVVVGGGLAGLWLALRAAPLGPVLLVTKGALGDGSTSWAQGGMAAAVGEGDSPAAHLSDTLAAGAGLCDPGAARAICLEAPALVRALARAGVGFDRDGDGPALGREGAHAVARVLHAGGDATGRHLAAALAEAVRADPRVEVLEGERAVGIVVRAGAVAGLRALAPDGAERVHAARAVALATGGAGHLYARTTNPLTATGDGPALAAAAGAALCDLEMVQFHPTALALGDSPLALVSEAVRGEGAVLRDARGRRFMRRAHPLAELGPRDVVARAIASRAAADGADVTLDLRALDPERVHARFPTVAALCRERGLDLARDPIPVTPAAHYAMGGVLTDLWGRSTLPGLWAVGECAATGAHGANRLASNSLLEAVVFADRAARAMTAAGPWPAHPLPAAAPLGAAQAPGAAAGVRPALQRAMWEGIGVERDASGMAAARRALDALPAPSDHEDAGLLALARLTARAAELRPESRGAHFRRDRPEPDPAWAVRIAWVGGEPYPIPRRAPTPVREAA